MNKLFGVFLTACLVSVLWLGPSTLRRIRDEKPFPIELIAKFEPWQKFHDLERSAPPWEGLKKLGFSTLLTENADPLHLRRLRQQGWHIGIILTQRTPLEHLDQLSDALVVIDESADRVSSAFITRLTSRPNLRLVKLEFQRTPSFRWVPAPLLRAVRIAHDIPIAQLSDLSPVVTQSRYLRAVNERRVPVLIFSPHPALPQHAQQLAWLSSLLDDLLRSGAEFGVHSPPTLPTISLRSLQLRRWGAWLIALLIPCLLGWGLSRAAPFPSGFSVWTSYGWVCLTVLAGGLWISYLLDHPAFSNKLIEFPAVKAALTAPLWGLAVMLAWSAKKDITVFLRKPAAVYHTAAVSFFTLLAFSSLSLLVIRSGNTGAITFPMEMPLRELLENWFGARPRFKEFLIGYPALMAYLMAPSIGLSRSTQSSRWLLLIGLIGPISSLNTFCHAHAPLSLSLLRTFHSVWLGGIIGLIATEIIKNVELRIKNYK